MTKPVLWTAQDIATLTLGVPHGGTAWSCQAFTLDGRGAKSGDVYVAIKGKVHDGHDFVAQAAQNGATAALVERVIPDVTIPQMQVRDAQKALEQLGAAARRRYTGKTIAITGSVGKTTTKELMQQALGASGTTQVSRASYNNFLGVPFTLANLYSHTQFGVFEVGMNHPFEIMPLTNQIRPDIAVVTWTSEAHIENMGSLAAIAHAKAELFDGLSQDGIAVLPADNDQMDALTALAKAKSVQGIYSFGKTGVHATLRDVSLEPNGMVIEAEILGERIKTRPALTGAHHAGNVLAALLTAKLLTGSAQTAAAALEGFTGITGRGARINLTLNGNTPITLIDESYNASPTAVRCAIESLGHEPGRHVAILGDMRELGGIARDMHLSLADPLRSANVKLALLCGENMAHLKAAIEQDIETAWYPDSATLLPHVLAKLHGNDTVLVKGSLSMKMKQIVEMLKTHAV